MDQNIKVIQNADFVRIPTPTQHKINLNTVIGLDTKMAVQTPPNSTNPPQRNPETLRSIRFIFIDQN